MVKGRRTRQANTAGQMLAVAEAGAAADDTASPKRKDFKYDNNASHFTTANTRKPASVPAEPMVLRGGRTKVNGIAKYLTSCNGTKPPVTAVVASSAPKMDNFIDLTDENTCDSFDNNMATNSSANPTESPLAALGFNVIKSNPASNIFLQEPVLSLNFDKTPSDKSRVVIKNSFLATEIQSKFSPPKCEPVWGDVAGAAAASNGIKRETPDYALDLSKPTQVTEIDSTTFLNQDSNSCDSGDSGVVILPSGTLEIMGTGGAVGGIVEGYSTRRKPATPHRILCPSPVKLPIVASPSTALAHMNIQNKRAARKNTKSKRRLHTKELENALEETVAECTVPSVQAMVIPVADVAPIKQELDKAKKPVLNDSVNPTAQQNTSNNNQSSKPPPSSGTEAPAAAAVITVGAANKARTATTGGGESGGTNKKLTDFFQVRRSVRKTKKEVQWERDRDIEKAIREQREAGLKVANFEGKGRGIITTRPFPKGEFVVEYIGDLVTIAEAKNREQIYAEDDNTGCYMYYFKHQNVQHCIDATAESGKLGRLVNHSRNGNLMTKTVSLNGRPHLVLIAKEDIAEGVEVTYDYGDRSKEALQHHPWLAF